MDCRSGRPTAGGSSSTRTARACWNLYSQAADGTGTVDRLTTSANPQFPTSITPDGTGSSASNTCPGRRSGVVLVSPDEPCEPTGVRSIARCEPVAAGASRRDPVRRSLGGVLARTVATSRTSRMSPGRSEVYVRPFPQVDSGRWQISTAGGTRPAWARSGRELFYLDASNTLTAVPVQTSGSTFSAGKPAKVFDAKYAEPFPRAITTCRLTASGS